MSMLPDLKTVIPGPRSRALSERLRRHESRNVTFISENWPVFWQRAEGCNVWDVDGNRFLDLTAAFGVATLGHTAPAIMEAAQKQAYSLMHAMGDVHPAEGKVLLCEKLSALTFERWGRGDAKVILGNSGFEAIEAALKTTLLATGKPRVLAFEGGYHGLGFGALATGGLLEFREPFRSQLADLATLLPYPTRAEELAMLRVLIEEAAGSGSIGAILVEPIQGRGGIVVPPDGFLRLLRQCCDAFGMLLIADEILTGFNRTGRLFACEHEGVVPDLVCVGKAFTGGFPMSACIGSAALMDTWPESCGEALHTSTYLGNPIGCAMAVAALGIHADPATAMRVRKQGDHLQSELAHWLPASRVTWRGRGLMQGLVLTHEDGSPDGAQAIQIVQAALRYGILILADGPSHNVLGITPPLCIDNAAIAFFSEWLRKQIIAA